MGLIVDSKLDAREALATLARVMLKLSEETNGEILMDSRMAWLYSRHSLDSPADIVRVMEGVDRLLGNICDLMASARSRVEKGEPPGSLTPENLDPLQDAALEAIAFLCDLVDALRVAS